MVEAGYLSRSLAVIGWEGGEQDDSYYEKERSDRAGDSGDDGLVGDHRLSFVRGRRFKYRMAPVEQRHEVDLLDTLDNGCSVYPRFDRRTTCKMSV